MFPLAVCLLCKEKLYDVNPTGQPTSHLVRIFFFSSVDDLMSSNPRYTLTEGDFHHLKNARLTNLHIPAPALNIVTIHECESVENSITMTTRPIAKSALSIFQVTAFRPLLLLIRN